MLFAYDVSGRLHSSTAHGWIMQRPLSLKHSLSSDDSAQFPTRSQTLNVAEAQIILLPQPGRAAHPTCSNEGWEVCFFFSLLFPHSSIIVTDPFRGRGDEGKGQRRPFSPELELSQDSVMLSKLVDDSALFGAGSLGATSCHSPLSPDFPALPAS